MVLSSICQISLEINIGALDEAIDKLDRKMNHTKVYM